MEIEPHLVLKRLPLKVVRKPLTNPVDDLGRLPLELVAIYAALGEKDKAFAWLERAYAEHSWPLFYMRVEPIFASLRSDPRFQAIVKRMRFP